MAGRVWVHWMGEGTVKLDGGMGQSRQALFPEGSGDPGRPVVENLALKEVWRSVEGGHTARRLLQKIRLPPDAGLREQGHPVGLR